MPSRTLVTPAAELALLRSKYPDGLICTSSLECGHRLIATTRAGYSRSGRNPAGEPCPLPEETRLAFVCADCRQTAAAAAQLAETRRAALATARAVAAQNRESGDACTLVAARTENAPADPHKQRAKEGRFRSTGDPCTLDLPTGSKRAGGRPRKHATDRARRSAAQRAYRDRQRAKQLQVSDATLAAIGTATA
jgi:hypothetical protein